MNKITPQTILTDSPINNRTLLVMAGGTGGHIFPGLAVAQTLASQGWSIYWLGTKNRMEAELVPQYGYPIYFVNIAGFRNKGWKTWLKTPFKIMQSIVQSIKILRAINPDVVLGMGGYASGPGGIAAWLLRKPLVLHEQNAVAGMTNRYLAFIATKVLAAFPHAFKSTIDYQVVGNPLRSDIIAIESVIPEKPSISKKVLVLGGSLGAQILNEVVPQAMKQIKLQNINVWHQTGVGKEQKVLNSYNKYGLLGERVKVSEFIDDMASAYQWADIVICRAGALTVSELAMAAKPAVFIPLPHAVDDHQTKNAMYLVSCGAAKLILQKDFNGTTLGQMLNSLFRTDKVIQSMSKAAHDAAHADATSKVAQICQSLVQK
ncbi:MAG: UDP-N-acetylglucosamine--N-acetylmuramyl-(pentapeptide) pyrophosphoryl-undecaprenol N-acetylglucosamine transferase [Alteromonadaceae bacterium]|jgi:UDP-N-acetylglucosamine--N-acetylmuramyl-(pentapeptide) pyrophosphoryl-undecaprenol N-acetylglucosamine transferase|tara:strand:- start:428 stop:1552 length:1125 start_codon:yes stop_codon:yes gene_type:complete